MAPPIELFGATQAALRVAGELGANDVPAARLYQKLANEARDQAKSLITAGNHPHATMLLRRALVDAELAVVLTKQARALREAEDLEARALLDEAGP